MALDAAYDMIAKNKTKGAALMRIELQTKQLLTSVPEGIYSDAIRQEQLQEIEFLIDHYFKLFRADGKDYAALVLSVYPQRKDYLNFQQALSVLEKQVSGCPNGCRHARQNRVRHPGIEISGDSKNL